MSFVSGFNLDILKQARGDLLGDIIIKYVGGYDNGRHSGVLYLYENRLEYKAVWGDPSIVIQADDIVSFEISGRQETRSRLTVPRMLVFGVFSLAVPKRDSVKEASITVGLEDGRQVMFHTQSHTEYEVHKKLMNGVSRYSKLRANKAEASAKPDQVDLLEKYAALYKKGILAEEEFKARKKQLLDL